MVSINNFQGNLPMLFSRMTLLATLILSLLTVNSTFATKPTVKKRTKKEREKILSRKYDKTRTKERSELVFMQNLERDCKDHAYHKKDFDLQVEKIYLSYPKKLRAELIGKNAHLVCIKNIIRLKAIDEEVITKGMIFRVAENTGGRYWPYTLEEEFLFLVKELSNGCNPVHVEYLDKTLDVYWQQTRNYDGYCKRYHEEFEKNCPEQKLKSCRRK